MNAPASPGDDPSCQAPGAIELATLDDGSLLYLVPFSAGALPPISGRDLRNAWDAARQAAGRVPGGRRAASASSPPTAASISP